VCIIHALFLNSVATGKVTLLMRGQQRPWTPDEAEWTTSSELKLHLFTVTATRTGCNTLPPGMGHLYLFQCCRQYIVYSAYISQKSPMKWLSITTRAECSIKVTHNRAINPLTQYVCVVDIPHQRLLAAVYMPQTDECRSLSWKCNVSLMKLNEFLYDCVVCLL